MYALKALRQKRATLAGEIVQLEKTIAWKRSQLEHVDATLEVFGLPDPRGIKPVKPYRRIALFKQGELSRLVRDALRESGKAVRTRAVIEAVGKKLGADHAGMHALTHRVTASLEYLSRHKGAVEKIGKRSKITWRLR